MSVATLAKRNALDPYRSRSLWVLLGLFVLVFGAVGYLLDPEFTQLPDMLPSMLVVLGPLAVLAFCYDAIAGPRQSGSLRVLLSYPYSRRDVVLGTVIGRVAVLSLAVVVGIATAFLMVAGTSGSVPDLVSTGIVLALTLLLTVAMVGVVLGISATLATTTRAAVVSFGAYLMFSGFWGVVPSLVRYVLEGFSFAAGEPPEWVFVWNQLNPFNAYRSATQALLDTPLSEAYYHAPWFGLVVLVGWIVLPLALGMLRFERADL